MAKARKPQVRPSDLELAHDVIPVAVAGRPELWRALTPRVLLDSTPAEWLFRLSAERRHLLLLTVLAAAVFFPYLGAVGFWDPWEVHYGEVAREMIQRGDFIHPYWENAYFFSKPVLSLWMLAAGMLASGANDPARGISVSTEWWVRSIFALVAIVGVLFTYLAVARTISRRAALWAGVILATSPLYFLLARQAVVDMPFVVFNTAAIGCLMIAVFEKERVQDGWLYAFYALAGVATLAKGLIGIALPGAAMLGYLVLSGDWRLLTRLRLLTGPLVTLLVCGPWYGTMIAFDGKDDESKTFWTRFFVHDHFKRAGGGVHTTTPNTTFVYYIEQLGFALFPWVALVPGALAAVAQPLPAVDARTRKDRARLFVIAWALTSLTFFAFVTTKFHHYAFPALPALAILIALFAERVLEDGVKPHALALLCGGVLFALIAQNLTMEPKHLVNMFVYNYERAYPSREVDPRWVFSVIFILAPVAALLGVPAIRGWFSKKSGAEESTDRLYVIGAATLLAAVFSIYVSAYHWRKLTPHWTQRDLFWSYHQLSSPTEPIAAYQMNWRGETFYSRNTVRQVKEAADLKHFVDAPGREWVLVEHSRLAGLRTTVGSAHKVSVVDKTSNKFALVSVD